ncbi:hypothetical protein GDO86_014757 [Hymenochirus boettgeri]|uniref:peptidylprolyl isomerase n=1 Tax=Hymenochirus boettgeri TaxID=247094 RepID=A0A8T2JYA4_9PIPI|nr:hypothetical protein GDO86_014757 [Hymenochirus boettgeri]
MFGADDEDTDFLSPTGGAKLASLFGMDQTVSGQGNESFHYTAPKQPKKASGAVGPKPTKPTGSVVPSSAPAVLYATAVHAYRFINGQYVKQGKFGAAVLGNHTTKEYRILLYVSQQQPVTAAKIHVAFVFTVQPNNYAAFYDDQRQNWSIMFESEVSAVDFSKQVCIAKFNCSPSLDVVLVQDLLPGDGQGAEVGDLLEVAYTGWLFQNQELGQVFDSNLQKDKLLRLKLGSGKVIKGWEDGMLGMKKGGKRLLIIPPALGYGSQGVSGRISPNATLVFEVEIKRMKVKDHGSDRQSTGSRDSPMSLPDTQPTETLSQPPSSIPPKPGEAVVRAKSNSISEQLANPDVAKAKLISRMAKMGQPMLPFLPGTPQPDSSDSEIEDPNTQRASPHPPAPLPIRPTPQITHTANTHVTPAGSHLQPAPSLQGTSTALLPAGPIQAQPITSGAATAFQPYNPMQYPYAPNPATQIQTMSPMYPPQLQPPAPYQASGDVMSFLMTEARQHSTEIRMSVGKIGDKIDNLASKVDNLQKESSSGATHLLPGITSITMESAMIMNNIQRIIQENERLKHEVLDKSSRIEEQNVKIGELINRNQKYMEQSNLLMEQRNDTLKTTAETTQARMLNAVQEKVKVAEDLAAATSQVSRLQLEVTAYQKKETELRMQLEVALQEVEKSKSQLSSLQVQFIEAQETSEQSKTRAKSEKETRRQMESRLAALEEEMSDLKAEKENLEKNLAERKTRSQLERQRAEEEKEELRRSLQDQMETLRQVIKKTREQAAADQVSSRNLDDQRLCELQNQAGQLQPLKGKCTELERQVAALREERSKRLKENNLSPPTEDTLRIEKSKLHELQEAAAELQPLREKYEKLKSQSSVLLDKLNQKRAQESPAKGTTEEVKKIMNGVFQTLRGEFEVDESYSGREVLGTIMSTIKATTLQLLNQKPASESSSEEENEDHAAEIEEEDNAGKGNTGNATKMNGDSVARVENEDSVARVENENSPKPGSTALGSEQAPHDETLLENRKETEEGDAENPANEVEEEQVKVIPENVEESSALVHMISSDMCESSVVTCVQEGPCETGQEPIKAIKDSEGQLKANSTGIQPIICDLVNETSSRASVKSDCRSPNPLDQGDHSEDGKLEPLPLGRDEEANSLLPPTDKAKLHEVPTGKNRGPDESKRGMEESDEEDLFSVPSPIKSQKSKQEEEEEEEVSMKGRPPPAPLFGEDEDDEDFDWLG